MTRARKYIVGLALLLLSAGTCFTQNKLAGRIFDSVDNTPLAFVNIVYNAKNYGTTTDLNGFFNIDNFAAVEFLEISYIGYHTIVVTKSDIGSKRFVEIGLSPDRYTLDEVTIVPGVNPAHRIIDSVVANADKNNPEKMGSFAYRSYNKMYFTVDMSAVPPAQHADTQQDTSKSGVETLRDYFDARHLFITETVSDRQFRYPDKNKEIVLANRVSGLKNPGFILLASQIQSFSFYNDFISLLDKKYLSPISRGCTKKYFFQLEDTLFTETLDTIFVISYRPLRGKNFVGLEGVLHINSHGYALQSVKAVPYEPTGDFNIRIRQQYELIDSTQWFPVQLNTDLIFNILQMNLDKNEAYIGNPGDKRKKDGLVPLIGVGRSYITNIRLNPDINRKEFGQVELNINDDATKKSSDFWDIFRVEPLSDKDIETYKLVDSIGNDIKLDRKMEAMEIMTSGYIPIGFINLDVMEMLWYNKYERYRLGLALHTNERMLKWFNIGGHFAYGTGDKAFKYGGFVKFIINKPTNTYVGLGYKSDLIYSDEIKYFRNLSLVTDLSVRDFFVSELDSVTKGYVNVNFSPVRYLTTTLRVDYSRNHIIDTMRYDFRKPVPKEYFSFETGMYLRYAYNEKFVQTPKGNRLSLGTKFPILYLNVIKGLPCCRSTVSYLKVEAMISKRFQWRSIGDTYVSVGAAMLFGDIPYGKMYYIGGNRTWLNVDNAFNTMRIGEFIADRFVVAFVRHDFGSLLFKTKKWAPRIALITAAGVGDNKYIGNTQNEHFAKRMNKGFFESGMQINDIVKISIIGYGIGVYYRYGAYAFDKQADNWNVQLTMKVSL